MRVIAPVLVVLALASTAHASVLAPVPGMVKADGEIANLTRAGSRIVLTGDFRRIGTYVGGGVALDPRSGARDASFARIDGQVSDVLADGSGGWYVAGQFRVAGRERSVAHVSRNGVLDTRFDARVGGFATSLLLHDGRLYAGRFFGTPGLVALDPVTGERLRSFPLAPQQQVTELAAAGQRIYVGTTAGVRSFYPDGQVRGWGCSECDDRVTALLATPDRLYVGFRQKGLLALHPESGARLEGFAPQPNEVGGKEFDAGPMVLALHDGRLIAGGRAMKLGGDSSTLVALNPETGAADAGYARGLANPVHDLIDEGGTLLVAGAPLGNATYAPLLRLDADTGAYRDSLVPELDGPIDALASANGRVFAGGRFGTEHAVRTHGVAEVDARSGRVVPGFAYDGPPPNRDEPLVSGGRIFLPGWNGDRARAIAISAKTGARMPGYTATGVTSIDGRASWAAGGGRLYVAHGYRPTGSIWVRSAVTVLSAKTGRRVARHVLPYDGYVDDTELLRGALYLGGSFLRSFPDGTPRNLATLKVDPGTGAVDERFDAHTDGPVAAVEGFRDRLYLGGYYSHAYGLERDGFASVYSNTGAINARFNRSITNVFEIGSGSLLGSLSARDGRPHVIDPYTGRSYLTMPAIRPGFGGDDLVLAGGGTFVTATLNLPYYRDESRFDNYAGYVPFVG